MRPTAVSDPQFVIPMQPTAVTYGVLLVACERRRDVDRAFQLYQCACDEVS